MWDPAESKCVLGAAALSSSSRSRGVMCAMYAAPTFPRRPPSGSLPVTRFGADACAWRAATGSLHLTPCSEHSAHGTAPRRVPMASRLRRCVRKRCVDPGALKNHYAHPLRRFALLAPGSRRAKVWMHEFRMRSREPLMHACPCRLPWRPGRLMLPQQSARVPCWQTLMRVVMQVLLQW